MATTLAITGARLSWSLAGAAGEERYVLEVSLKNPGGKPIKSISLQVLDGDRAVGTGSFDFARLEPGDPGCRVAGVVLSGLDGPGPGGWADAPAWLREGRDLEVRLQVIQTTMIFTRWLNLPRVADRKTCRVRME